VMRYVNTSRPARLVGGLALASGLVLTGCSDSAGPEAGAVTTEDLQQLEEQVTALDDRLGALEEGGVAGAEEASAEQPDIIGQEATVSAEVSEVLTTNDAGSAFRIGGESGPSVAVLSGTAPEGLDANDTVRITGTVQRITRDSFEQDFGLAEDELFEDPEGFFSEFEGQPAIAATEIEVLQAQAD
jgi:hypothetical protein